MIDKLEMTYYRDKFGNCRGSEFPSNREIFNKVNEIIDLLNVKLIEDKGEYNENT